MPDGVYLQGLCKKQEAIQEKKYFSIRKWDLDLSKDKKRKNKRYSYQRKDTCVGILLCPRGERSARFCTFLLILTWMLVCFSVVGQKFIVQWSNILLHEHPQGKSVKLWKKNAKLKRLFSNFMFASFQPVVSPFSVRLIKQVKSSSLITR